MELKLDINDEVHIRLGQLNDAQELYNLLDSNRIFLSQWLPRLKGEFSIIKCVEDYEKLIEEDLETYENNKSGLFLIIYRNKIVGTIVLQRINWENKSAGISYWLGEVYQGNGLVTQSLSRLLEYAFHDLELNKVFIQCALGNIKSEAIPIRLGFSKDGIDREDLLIDGKLYDVIKYSLLKREYNLRTNQIIPQQNF